MPKHTYPAKYLRSHINGLCSDVVHLIRQNGRSGLRRSALGEAAMLVQGSRHKAAEIAWLIIRYVSSSAEYHFQRFVENAFLLKTRLEFSFEWGIQQVDESSPFTENRT